MYVYIKLLIESAFFPFVLPHEMVIYKGIPDWFKVIGGKKEPSKVVKDLRLQIFIKFYQNWYFWKCYQVESTT